MRQPWCVVVAGVSGSGKTTVARELAERTGAEFVEGDDLHTEAAVAKMRSGVPLTDADRAPWLVALAGVVESRYGTGTDLVLSCSALRRTYRDVLATGRPWVGFCLLDVPRNVLQQRVEGRTGHFMPASLLASQLALLEPLEDDERGATIDAQGSPEEVTDQVVRALALV